MSFFVDEWEYLGYRPLDILSVHLNPQDDWIMATLRAYLDDSGSPEDKNHSFLTMAGWVSVASEWRLFEKSWKDTLSYFGVEYFHMKEMNSPNSPISHLDKNKVREFFMLLVNAIHNGTIFGVSCSIRLQDLREFNKNYRLYLDPYALAIYGCMRTLSYECSNDKVEIVVDNFDRSMARVAQAFGYYSSDTGQKNPSVIYSFIQLCRDDNFKNILPLQASDFLAWEDRKNLEERKDFNPSYEKRMDKPLLTQLYNAFEVERSEVFSSPVRSERKSLKELTGGGAKVNSCVWTIDDLEAARARHQNGWIIE